MESSRSCIPEKCLRCSRGTSSLDHLRENLAATALEFLRSSAPSSTRSPKSGRLRTAWSGRWESNPHPKFGNLLNSSAVFMRPRRRRGSSEKARPRWQFRCIAGPATMGAERLNLEAPFFRYTYVRTYFVPETHDTPPCVFSLSFNSRSSCLRNGARGSRRLKANNKSVAGWLALVFDFVGELLQQPDSLAPC